MFKKIFTIIIVTLISINILGQSVKDSIIISNSELRIANLIFVEHQKLSNENPLLKQQINSLEELNKLYIKSDSIQKVEIDTYKDKINSDLKKINKLKSTQNTLVGVSILLFIIGLIL